MFLSGSPAFTVVEMMIAAALFGLVMSGAIGAYVMCQKLWHATSIGMATSRAGNLALSRLVYGVGTNNGLRTAASISIRTNYWKGRWTGSHDDYPLAPGDSSHFLNPGLPDGSWRITCSNAFDGEKWIDFNKEASNIVFCVDNPDPPTPANLSTRQLICNYVSDAVVSNNGLSGVNIHLTIIRQEGRFISTNQISTFVKRRN